MFYSEFARLNLCRANGHGFAEYIFCPFVSLVREYCSGASPPASIAGGHTARALVEVMIFV